MVGAARGCSQISSGVSTWTLVPHKDSYWFIEEYMRCCYFGVTSQALLELKQSYSLVKISEGVAVRKRES